MNEQEMKALFLLAGIEVKKSYALVNRYGGASREDPWWLVSTPFGNIVIGWRKRVIHIEWSETAVRKIVTADDVTKDEESVHAWGYAKAVEYLQNLHRAAKVINPPPVGNLEIMHQKYAGTNVCFKCDMPESQWETTPKCQGFR